MSTPHDKPGINADITEALARRRANGKVLMTEATAMALNSHQGWAPRRVDAAMRVMFHDWYWSVLDLPGVHVGDLVHCLPTRRGVFLRVRAGNEGQADRLASRLEPAHANLGGMAAKPPTLELITAREKALLSSFGRAQQAGQDFLLVQSHIHARRPLTLAMRCLLRALAALVVRAHAARQRSAA